VHCLFLLKLFGVDFIFTRFTPFFTYRICAMRLFNRSVLLTSLCLFALVVFLTGCSHSVQTHVPKAATRPLDLAKPEDNMTAFLKMRITTELNKEVYFYASGKIYSFVPGERDRALFDFEMYNVGKIVQTEGGYQMLTREVGFYRDLKTGEYLAKWENPWTKKTEEVIHVWNDPVNQKFQLEGPRGKWAVPFTMLGDRVVMNNDIFLTYPSPLKVAEYPENSASDSYEAAELFQFFAHKADLDNPAIQNAPAEVSWTRIGPWLPWMGMGQRAGNLVYQTRGYKTEKWEDLPQHMRDFIMGKFPEFKHAPDANTAENETSWTYFKKLKSANK